MKLFRPDKQEVESGQRTCRATLNKPFPLLPPGLPLGFPPFLFPPAGSLPEAFKDAGLVSGSVFPGLRLQTAAAAAGLGVPAPVFPPSNNLLDQQTQALLSLMKSQASHHQQEKPELRIPPLDLTSSGESPAKKIKRDPSPAPAPSSPVSSVSPPASSVVSVSQKHGSSVCSSSLPCTEDGRELINLSTDQVVDLVSSLDWVSEHAESFRREKIDGSSLVLLTEDHLTNMGLKLGPAIKFR